MKLAAIFLKLMAMEMHHSAFSLKKLEFQFRYLIVPQVMIRLHLNLLPLLSWELAAAFIV